jgi:hypothetical protein
LGSIANNFTKNNKLFLELAASTNMRGIFFEKKRQRTATTKVIN